MKENYLDCSMEKVLVVLSGNGPGVVLCRKEPRVVLGGKGPGVVLDEKGPRVVFCKKKGPGVVLGGKKKCRIWAI